MGYIKFILLFFLVFANQILPQIKWLSPSPSPGTIYSVFFVDSLYGWAAGASSCVLKTTDGGETWNEQTVPINTTLRKIYFSDRNKGVIIGGEVWAPYFGSVIVTTDGGNTWIDTDPIPYPSDTRGFNDLHFINESVGYIAGFEGVYRTTNMGQTWEPKGGSGWATAIYFIDPQTGFLGNTIGSLLKTTDSGGSWQEINSMHWTFHKDIKFLDSQIGWLVSRGLYEDYGIIRKTTDGGFTWAIQDSQVNTSYNAIEIIDSLNVMVVGDGGRISFTSDGGANWYYDGTNDNGDYFDIVLQGNRKWITGGKEGFPRLITSSESGYHWAMRSSELTENSIRDICFSDSLKGWLAGYGGTLFYTVDGGENWNPKSIFSIDFSSISTPTNQDIYVSGNNGEFIKSNNGGTNWQVNNIGNWLSETKIKFLSKDIGYCIAPYEGRLFKTTDAGNNWSDEISTGYYFKDFFFADSVNGWVIEPPICEGDYIVYRTSNGGETWEDSTHFNYIDGIYFLDSKIGWIVANYNGLYKTTNAGRDWEISAQLADFIPKELWFTSESQGYMIANSNTYWAGLYQTNDGGITWTPIRNYMSLNKIHLNQNNILCGVGDYGKLIKHKTIITSVENQKEEDFYTNSFKLLQNFPNPFNSNTIIRYNIKDGGLVKIKVYDILGSEVAELLKETKEAGVYSIEFNASNLPSGVYIYTLKVNSFSASQKMLLLK
ncbi:MAG: YCF48-related protein [Ignavibacteriaceae bacterium]